MTAPSKASFTVTTEHLARMMESARQKERVRIAALADQRAAEALSGNGGAIIFEALTALAEELRAGAQVRVGSVSTATTQEAVRTPAPAHDPLLADIDSEVAALESGGDGLPPVRHHDDFAEGQALARRHGFRG